MKGDDGWSVNVCFSCLGESNMCGEVREKKVCLFF